MQHGTSPRKRTNIDLASVLLGLGSGIFATLIFAIYKEREFDRLINNSRKMADSAGNFVENIGDEAQAMNSNLANAAHNGVRSVKKVSRDAIEAVQDKMHG